MSQSWKSFAAAGLLLAAALTTLAHAQPPTQATPEQALAELKQIGGVLIHYNDRLPEGPVLAVDFTNHPRFQEAWLRHLAALPRLSGLSVAGTPLSDGGLQYIKGLVTLETLDLAGTEVSDEGLGELLKLKQLRSLDVRGTKVTAAGVVVLRRYLPELEVLTGPLPDEAAPPVETRPETTAADVTSFTAARIKQLREKAMQQWLPREGDPAPPQGWSKSRVAPSKILEVFPPLRVKPEYVLRAYVFHEEGNGNGVVWALPADADFPEPKDSPALENHLLKAPKPFDALDDFMDAVTGDGSAASYLAASLMRRELREFGALGHGCNWTAHVVLDADPWKGAPLPENASPLDGPTSNVAQWKWMHPRPEQWRPAVQVGKDLVTVTYYTYSGLEKEAIYRHTDTYRTGKYRPKIEQTRIAEGPNGFAF